jgi:hypothetical protein
LRFSPPFVSSFVSSIQTNFHCRRNILPIALLLRTAPPRPRRRPLPKTTSRPNAPPHALCERPLLAWDSIRESLRTTPDYICAYGRSAGQRVPARGRSGLCPTAVCEGRGRRRTAGWCVSTGTFSFLSYLCGGGY